MKAFKMMLFGFLLLLLNCNYKSNNNKKPIDSDLLNQKKIISEKKYMINEDSLNFLANCNQLLVNSWQGTLQQVVTTKDSVDYLCFADCYECNPTFEAVFVYKGGVSHRKSLGNDSIWRCFQKGCSDNFENFNCFVFVSPLKNPDKQLDPHAVNIDFPVTVQIFKRLSLTQWKFEKSLRINSFPEYTQLQFKTIYELN